MCFPWWWQMRSQYAIYYMAFSFKSSLGYFFKFSNRGWPVKPEQNLLRAHKGLEPLFFFLLLVSSFSRCGWCDDWDIQGNTHPTYEALRVPERVESWYVVFQDGLTTALTAWRKQSQEALLAVLLAVTVMEACWRNGSNSFKCFFQYMLNSWKFLFQSVEHKKLSICLMSAYLTL